MAGLEPVLPGPCSPHPAAPAQAKRLVKNSIISVEAPEVELPEEDECDEVAAAAADVEAFRAAEGAPGDAAAEGPPAAPGEGREPCSSLLEMSDCVALSLPRAACHKGQGKPRGGMPASASVGK